MNSNTTTPTRPIREARPTDRVLEALATLAAFLDRTINEVKTLDQDFEERLVKAVNEAETSFQTQTASQIEQVRQDVSAELSRKFQFEFHAGLDALRNEFRSERERMTADIQRLTEGMAQASQTAARLEAERIAMLGDMQSLKEEADAAVAKAQAEVRASRERDSASEQSLALATLQSEMADIEEKVREIVILMDDPTMELSTVIRKNVEKSELEAYLKGIRVAIAGLMP